MNTYEENRIGVKPLFVEIQLVRYIKYVIDD